jgi:hypothetical protein
MEMQEKLLLSARSDYIALKFHFLNISHHLVVAQNLIFGNGAVSTMRCGPRLRNIMTGFHSEADLMAEKYKVRNIHCKRSKKF